jgi:hypothetical protein
MQGAAAELDLWLIKPRPWWYRLGEQAAASFEVAHDTHLVPARPDLICEPQRV